jgi:hypothetical protein
MGIKKLTSFLGQFNVPSTLTTETISSNSVLAVDASGFLFHVLRDKFTQGDILMNHLGDYASLNIAIQSEILKFTNFGIQVIFFVDGQSQMKYKTAEKRSQRITKLWDNLKKVCRSSRSISNTTDNDDDVELPIPILAFQQFYDTLKSLDISVIKCQYEADQEVAKFCRNYNTKPDCHNRLCYCLANDR